VLPLNNFAKTPDFRFWQKSGGIMSEILVLRKMSGQNEQVQLSINEST